MVSFQNVLIDNQKNVATLVRINEYVRNIGNPIMSRHNCIKQCDAHWNFRVSKIQQLYFEGGVFQNGKLFGIRPHAMTSLQQLVSELIES